jgi:GxxExxY protein
MTTKGKHEDPRRGNTKIHEAKHEDPRSETRRSTKRNTKIHEANTKIHEANTKIHEEYEDPRREFMLKNASPLSSETERIVESVIGCGVEVHRVLGPGFFEPIYHNALQIEFRDSKIPFESEKRVLVRYRDQLIGSQRLDFVVAGEFIVEIKAVKELEPLHHVQVMSYLRGTGLRVGLLMNFGGLNLRSGLKRIVI